MRTDYFASQAANAPADALICLPLHLKQMGTPENCGHRAGWRYVVDALRTVHGEQGLLLDDFVERTFQHQATAVPWTRPWVGIFHHPPHLPDWLDPTAPPEVYLRSPAFQQSLPQLRGAVVLSQYLGHWLRHRLNIPVLVLKHPTEVPALKFSMAQWLQAPRKRLVQIGWYARNYRAIYQAGVPGGFEKIHLLQDRPWVHAAHARTDQYSPFRQRPDLGSTQTRSRLPDVDYDALLASSLVLAEYFDVSASNTVIECIARNTPMVVNRHPAIEEYLGADYPLLYGEFAQVPALLADPARVLAAHQALQAMDKDWLDVQQFRARILSFIRALPAA